MSSCHGMYSEWDMDDPRFKEYQCFSDGENHDFRSLDQSFPDSRFILTSRGLEGWLVSRIRHVEVRRTLNKTGWMRKEYEANPKKAIERWIKNRREYHSQALNYFAERPTSFLKLNICDCRDKGNSISTLFKFLQLPEDKAYELPHERSTDRVTRDVGGGIKNLFTKSYKPRNKVEIQKEVQAVLIELNIPEAEWSSDGFF